MRNSIICLLLITATLAIYTQTVGFDFVNYDDVDYVTENVLIKRGLTWKGIHRALTSSDQTRNWHPLTSISHMLDCEFYGLKSGGHHATSVMLHTLNGLLLFGLLKTATGRLWCSALVAALFALHPLRVESVAWIAERKDVLSAFFGLLALWSYVAYAKNGGWRRYLLTWLLLAAGLMSKPMLVTLPAVMLLLDLWPLGRLRIGGKAAATELSPSDHGPDPWRSLGRLLLEKVPFFALSTAVSMITVVVQAGGNAVASLDLMSFPSRVSNAVVSYGWYIGKLFWPSRLAVHYEHPERVGGELWPMWQIAAVGLLLLAISCVTVLAVRKRYLLMGWLWYLGMLVPVIGLVQVGSQARADRYTYLPSIGLAIMLVWAGSELLERLRRHQHFLHIAAALLMVAALLALTVRSWDQARIWRDSFALYNYALEVRPPNSKILNNRGAAYTTRGHDEQEKDPVAAKEFLILALRDFDQALNMEDVAQTYTNRGSVYMLLGDSTLALRNHTKAIEVNPKLAEAWFNRGRTYLKTSRPEDAVADFTESIRLMPNDPHGLLHRGVALHQSGQSQQAVADFTTAIELAGEYTVALNNRGNAYQNLEQPKLALADYNRALEMDPEYGKAYGNRGNLYLHREQYESALKDFDRSIELEADNPDADDPLLHHSRGIAHLRLKQPQQAVADFTTAIDLKNDLVDAYVLRGKSHQQLGRYDLSLADYRKAIELDPLKAEFHNNLAWLLATCPDPQHRDGPQAVSAATRACELTSWKDAGFLDTLAATYARSGNFEKALEYQQQAIDLAPAAIKQLLQSRMELYRQNKAFPP